MGQIVKPFSQLLILFLFLQACSGIQTEKPTPEDDFTAGVEVGDPGKMPKRLLIAMKSGKKAVRNIDLTIHLDQTLKKLGSTSDLISFFIYKVEGGQRTLIKSQTFKAPSLPASVTLSIEDFPSNKEAASPHYLIFVELKGKESASLAYGLTEVKNKTKTDKPLPLTINKVGKHK